MKRLSSSILVTERWVWSLSRCTGSQLTSDFSIHPCSTLHYFLPGLRSLSQPKNVAVLRPVPSYTAWWQRHMDLVVNNLPKVVTQFFPGGNWTHDLLIASPTPYRYATVEDADEMLFRTTMYNQHNDLHQFLSIILCNVHYSQSISINWNRLLSDYVNAH